jgi:hypothetical protein
MEAIFEAKYISIEWYNSKRILKVQEAQLPISIETESPTHYAIELQTYTRLANGSNGQIAFHLLDLNSTIEPYFIDASNNKIPMLKVIDPNSNKAWWIEDGEWSKQYQLKTSPLWNHVGKSVAVFGDIVCRIESVANSFTKEQLELYLQDFRNDFWYLILQKNSLTQGEVKKDTKNTTMKLLENKDIELITKFIEVAQKVLQNPKKELREVQALKDRNKVKPIPRTFMEIATSGLQKRMSSRDTIESYNVAENRYIYYTLQNIYTLIQRFLDASKHIKSIYTKKAQYDKERLEGFTDIKTIDREVLENEIIELESAVSQERINLKNSLAKQNHDILPLIQTNISIQKIIQQQNSFHSDDLPQTYTIRLDTKNEWSGQIQFWGGIKNNQNKNYTHKFGFSNNSYQFIFNNPLLNSTLQLNQEYKITAYIHYSKFPRKTRGEIHQYRFLHIVDFQLLNYENINYRTVTIKLNNSKTYYSWLQFNGELQLPNKEWYEFKNKKDFFSFQFDKNIFENILKNKQTYKVTAYVQKQSQDYHSGTIHKRTFKYITDIELIGKSPLEQKLEENKQAKQSLEASNWKRKLNKKEIKAQEYEKQALAKEIKNLQSLENDNTQTIKQLEPTVNQLKKFLLECKKLNITQDSYFPNSMTFIQNPNYQGVHRYFKKLNDITGIESLHLESMEVVEKMGLLDIPKLYERWCFLQIIKVLMEKYHFQPQADWKNILAKQTTHNLNNLRDVKLSFVNESTQRKIDLWYEKVLPNNKRADFVLDIQSMITNKTHRLVMDAKFHENVNIKQQIDLLYHQKNYAQNQSNSVFILHPDTNKSIKMKKTAKEWANDAYYGEVEMFNFQWDYEKNPNHKYGAILLSPIEQSGNFLDNLQRLIGMAMQYNLEDNQLLQKDPEAKEKYFCLVCGDSTPNVSKSPTQHGYRYKINCNKCNHYYEYNYCWSCQNRLIKNGRYWSYHSSKALNEFNIECPYCSEFLQ